jgi:hypothetical protein
MLYSASRLGIAGPGVTVEESVLPDSAYKFCYRGLRLVIRTGSDYILAPVGWQWGIDRLHTVPVGKVGRFDMVPAGVESAAAPAVCSTLS